MEYLIYLTFFAGGWILSKRDTRHQNKKSLPKLFEKAYIAGVQYGHAETMKRVANHKGESNHEDSATVGFSIPTMKAKEFDQ